MATQWTNAVAPGTPMQALDVREIRQAIDQNRSAAGLYAFRWTDSVKDGANVEIGPLANTPVRAVHFIDARFALHDLWARKHLG